MGVSRRRTCATPCWARIAHELSGDAFGATRGRMGAGLRILPASCSGETGDEGGREPGRACPSWNTPSAGFFPYPWGRRSRRGKGRCLPIRGKKIGIPDGLAMEETPAARQVRFLQTWVTTRFVGHMWVPDDCFGSNERAVQWQGQGFNHVQSKPFPEGRRQYPQKERRTRVGAGARRDEARDIEQGLMKGRGGASTRPIQTSCRDRPFDPRTSSGISANLQGPAWVCCSGCGREEILGPQVFETRPSPPTRISLGRSSTRDPGGFLPVPMEDT